jgi:hypothetical protein
MKKHFAVLDMDASEISAVAARWTRSGEYVIEGYCRAASEGIRKGGVTDMSRAVGSIRKAIRKLNEKISGDIHDVYCGISSASLSIVPSSATVLLSRYGREIGQRDIDRCVEMASIIKMPLNKEPLHREVWGFSVDGEKGLDNPLNLEGVKLSADVNVLTINSTALRNMEKCLAQAGLNPEALVPSGLASSCRTFSERDRKEEVCFLDMGRDLTEALLFFRGRLRDCRAFPFGVEDIVSSGKVSEGELDKLAEGMGDLQGWGAVKKVIVARQGALDHTVLEALEDRLKLPVSAATCVEHPFEDLPHEKAGYIAPLGILDYLREHVLRTPRSSASSLPRRLLNRSVAFIDRYF